MRRPALWLPALSLLVLAAGAARAADRLETMEQNGPSDNRIDLVITGDGYTAAQADDFRQDTERLLDGLFGAPPWSAYRGMFNLYRVVTESAESGADHPSQGIQVDTYFDSQFDYFGMARLTHADEGKILSVVSDLVPEVDQIILLINDPAYGGSGGSVAMASVDPDAVYIVLHELGHSFADLADEYTEAYPGYPAGDPEPNVDVDATFADIKWNAWIESGTPLPTLLSDATDAYHPVGAYEGARYLTTGIYRPAPHCIMEQLIYRYCDVCQEAITLAFYRWVDPVDQSTPITPQVKVDRGGTLPVRFQLDVVQVTDPAAISVRWRLDDREVGAGTELAFDPNVLGVDNGVYTLTAQVRDDTPWVRHDPDGLRESERSWTVTVDGVEVDGVEVDAALAMTDGGSVGDGGTAPPPGDGGCGCSSTGIPLGALLPCLLLFGGWLSRRGGRIRRSAS